LAFAEFPIIDIHAHVLAGLDDGPSTQADSLRVCEALAAQGVQTVVATPHLCDPRFPLTPADIRDGVRHLSDACRRQGIPVRIVPGAEVRLQPEFLEFADHGRLVMVPDGGCYVLLELPVHVVPMIERLPAQLAAIGLTAILAHAERHRQFQRNLSRLEALVEAGFLVQITAASIVGAMGAAARETAERMLRSGLAHAVASDAHSARGRRAPQFEAAVAELVSVVGVRRTHELLWANPRRILRGEPLVPAVAEGAMQDGVSRRRLGDDLYGLDKE